MKTFNEKCDKVLNYLSTKKTVTWSQFLIDTGLKKGDAIISYLLKKGLIEYGDNYILISFSGIDFIGSTSFVELRDKLS